MKKHSTKTTFRNLESRFEKGEDVLDYFNTNRVTVTHGGARTGAGRKPLGKLRKTIKLSPQAVRRFEAYARRKSIGNFSAAIEAASELIAS